MAAAFAQFGVVIRQTALKAISNPDSTYNRLPDNSIATYDG